MYFHKGKMLKIASKTDLYTYLKAKSVLVHFLKEGLRPLNVAVKSLEREVHELVYSTVLEISCDIYFLVLNIFVLFFHFKNIL